MGNEWRELCETIRDTAEGYAATDPQNAWKYREEAAEFCALDRSTDADELALREAEAETLRRKWSARFRRRKKP